jgi:hypothetical protein
MTIIQDDSISQILAIKIICSSISILSSLFIITLYLVMTIKSRCTSNATDQLSDTKGNPEIGDSLLLSHTQTRIVKHHKGKHKMGFGNDIVLLLCLSYLFYNLTTFIYIQKFPEKKDYACTVQALLLNFFDISAIAWTACLSRVTLLGISIVDILKVRRHIYLFVLYAYLPAIALCIG